MKNIIVISISVQELFVFLNYYMKYLVLKKYLPLFNWFIYIYTMKSKSKLEKYG